MATLRLEGSSRHWHACPRGLSALVVLFLLSGVISILVMGCGGKSGAIDDARPVDALKRVFPAHAARVLHGSEAFVASSAGFAPPLTGDPFEAVARRSGLSIALPNRGEEAIRFHVLGSFQIAVREIGASGEGELAEGAVTYRRKGGTSFWSVTDTGYWSRHSKITADERAERALADFLRSG